MRRARIKPVANLSAARRPINKSTSAAEGKEELDKKQNEKIESVPQQSPRDDNVTIKDKIEDVPSVDELAKSSSENVEKSADDEIQRDKIESAISQSESLSPIKDETATFKTPMQLPRNEADTIGSSSNHSSANKFKRFKLAPRLNASRNVQKFQEVDTIAVPSKEIPAEDHGSKNLQSVIQQKTPQADEKMQSPEFTLPSPTRSRVDFSRDTDSPNFGINLHIQHPSAPPSPFLYHSHAHSRIRTDSLCSIKSNRDITVANLQPRKNIRTEDQKIIDIKRESRERLSNKDLDKSKLRMFDMIYFNPQNNPMKVRTPHKVEKPKEEVIKEVPVIKPKDEPPAAMPVPQLRLNANGDMVLDETSLVIENEQQKQNRILLATSNVVYDDDLSGNYGYYKRQQRTKEWQHEETVKFYRCLNTVGTDFSLMLNLFPNRTRRDLKLKFKKEEKNNGQLIDKALLKHNTFDLDELQKDLDREEEERRKEAESKSNSEVKELIKRKLLKKQEAKQKLLDAKMNLSKSKVEKMLTDGELAMSVVDSASQQDAKENLASAIVPRKRQRKTKTEVEDFGVYNVIELKSPTGPLPDFSMPEPPKKKRAYRKKAVTQVVKMETSSSVEVPVTSPLKMEQSTITSAISNAPSWSYPAPPDFKLESLPCRPALSFVDTSGMESYPLSSVPVVSVAESEEAPVEEHEHQITTLTTVHDMEVDLNVNQDIEATENVENVAQTEEPALLSNEPLTSSIAYEIVDVPLVEAQAEVVTPAVIEEAGKDKKVEKKPKGKSRRNKFKPTLVTRLKLDADGEMVLDDSAADKETPPEPSTSMDSEPISASVGIENLEGSQQVFVDENLNETNDNKCDELDQSTEYGQVDMDIEPPIPSGSSGNKGETFDSEAFLNSLDLEKLVLVEAQRNGKDVFEIHEIDPITQEICDLPLDIPDRFVDLIISVMTATDEDDDNNE